MANRKFLAEISEDQGHTWKSVRSTGWAISDASGEEKEDDFGFVIALTWDGTMVDIGIPEHMLKLIAKDISKLKAGDARVRRRVQSVEVNPTDSGAEDQS